jgi:excisionase family DNA binding protein
MSDPADLLDEQQVMRLLRVSKRTLQRLRQKGNGPPHIKVGRRILYRRQAVEKWLEAREKGGP